MKTSDYLRKRRGLDLAYQQTFRQYMVDMLMITLHDPEIMGKDTFGKERLKRVLAALDKNYHAYFDALRNQPETDYQRDRLDRALREILGNDLVPFEKRYDFVHTVRY